MGQQEYELPATKSSRARWMIRFLAIANVAMATIFYGIGSIRSNNPWNEAIAFALFVGLLHGLPSVLFCILPGKLESATWDTIVAIGAALAVCVVPAIYVSLVLSGWIPSPGGFFVLHLPILQSACAILLGLGGFMVQSLQHPLRVDSVTSDPDEQLDRS